MTSVPEPTPPPRPTPGGFDSEAHKLAYESSARFPFHAGHWLSSVPSAVEAFALGMRRAVESEDSQPSPVAIQFGYQPTTTTVLAALCSGSGGRLVVIDYRRETAKRAGQTLGPELWPSLDLEIIVPDAEVAQAVVAGDMRAYVKWWEKAARDAMKLDSSELCVLAFIDCEMHAARLAVFNAIVHCNPSPLAIVCHDTEGPVRYSKKSDAGYSAKVMTFEPSITRRTTQNVCATTVWLTDPP